MCDVHACIPPGTGELGDGEEGRVVYLDGTTTFAEGDLIALHGFAPGDQRGRVKGCLGTASNRSAQSSSFEVDYTLLGTAWVYHASGVSAFMCLSQDWLLFGWNSRT